MWQPSEMLQHTNTVDSKTGEITELWRMATWCHTIADLHIKRTFGYGKCEQSLTTPLNTSSFIIKAAFFQFHPLWQHVDRPLVEVKPEVGHVVALPFKEIALRMRYDNGGGDGGGGGGGGIPTCK